MDLIYNRGSAADQWERIDFPIKFWFLIMVYSILHPATPLKEFPTVTHTPHSLPSMPSSSQLLKCTRRMPPSKPLSNWSFCMAWFAPRCSHGLSIHCTYILFNYHLFRVVFLDLSFKNRHLPYILSHYPASFSFVIYTLDEIKDFFFPLVSLAPGSLPETQYFLINICWIYE